MNFIFTCKRLRGPQEISPRGQVLLQVKEELHERSVRVHEVRHGFLLQETGVHVVRCVDELRAPTLRPPRGGEYSGNAKQ